MVKPMGPAKFYGRSLPRPRIYTDVKFSTKRIDPPPPVLESLMKWANEAPWSMGGLSFDRKRIQGKTEGNLKKLRAQNEEQKEEEEQSANRAKPTANVTPPMEPHHVILRSPAEDETPDFVPDSYKRPSGRHSPRVPSRVRKLGGVFEQQVSQKKGYLPKRKLSPQLGVFDWIPVPDKLINATSRKKDRRRSEGSVRRSARLSEKAPAPP